jgi:hypothetical protein
MAVGDGAPVHVDFLHHILFGHAQDGAGADENDGREGLVDLDQVDLVHRQVVLFEDLLDRKSRDGGDVLGRLGDLRITENREEGLQAEFLRFLGAHEHAHVPAVVHSRRVARCYAAQLPRHGALVVEDGGQLGQAI